MLVFKTRKDLLDHIRSVIEGKERVYMNNQKMLIVEAKTAKYNGINKTTQKELLAKIKGMHTIMDMLSQAEWEVNE